MRLTFSSSDSVEVCSSRLVSGYSYDVWPGDMYRNTTTSCDGFNDYHCEECSEDFVLEYELDEW